jgi:SAM-dependent methyltransferase
VLATDIDVSWTEPAAGGALEVRRHDVIRDPPPAETFDLVHARLVLVHLKDRAAAMRVMIDALRPGGWLVIEDARTDDHRMGPQAGLTIHRGEGCLWQQICQWPCQCRLSGDAEFDRMDSRDVSVLSVLTAQSATAVHLVISGLKFPRSPPGTVAATGSPDSCGLQRCSILAAHTTWRSEMAQRTVVRLTDDLSGVEIPAGKGETVTFSLDGWSYEIDLTAKNANALRKALRPYIEAGRPIKNSRRHPTRTRVAADTRTVKEWARANGYQVRERGRIPKAVIDAFDATN